MHNISGPDHVAARVYLQLVRILASPTLRVHLRTPKTWQHILGLSAACRIFSIPLEIHIDSSQQLNVFNFYAIWGSLQMGAKVSRAPFTGQFTRDITSKQEEEAMNISVDELLKEIKDDILVIPLETSCFSRHDFTQAVRAKRPCCHVVGLPLENENDYTCWIQTANLNINYGYFFYYISQGEQFNKQQLIKNYDFLPEKLIPDISFDNFDIFENELHELLNERFYTNLPQIDNVLEVTEAEMLEAFRQFINQSHSLATGSFLTPLAGVLSKKFSFTDKSQITVWITGAIQSTLHQQDFLTYTQYYIKKALEKSYELISMKVEIDVDDMQQVIELMDILDKNVLIIQSWKFEKEFVALECMSPGYDPLMTTIAELKLRFGKKSVICNDIPKRAPPLQKATNQDYSAEHGDNTVYTSNLNSLQDITPESVKLAYERLVSRQCTDKTGVLLSQHYTQILGHKVYFVMENLQQTGSFKIRGATNMLLKAIEQNPSLQGVVACSAGNHAQGVAKTSKALGIKCTIVCPESAPATKLYATQRYGAEVIKHGPVFDAAQSYALNLAKQRNWLFVPPFNSFDVVEGQATIAYEMYQKIKPDTVIVNVGGGGMIAGITTYMKKVAPNTKIVAIQAEKVFPLEGYENTHKFVDVDKTAATIADGCNVKIPGGVHSPVFDEISQYVGVSENEIAATIINFLLTTKTVTEGAGCMGLAALLYKKYIPAENESIAVVICGGNIDLSRIAQIFQTGTISMGKYMQMKMLIGNGPGQLLKVMKTIQKFGGVCDKIRHTRNDQKCDWDRAWMTIGCRVPCMEACDKLKRALKDHYNNIIYPGEDIIPK
eukprot:EST45732.1 Threonine dehydratase [Spironucleus salmonicida]